MGCHHSYYPFRKTRRDRERERGETEREGAIETLLYDVIWLIEATFNLHCSPRLWYGETERVRERERERERERD